MANCTQCGAPIKNGAETCKYCGEPVARETQNNQQQANFQQPINQQPVYRQPIYQQPVYQSNFEPGVNPAWPIKNKIVAGLLAIFLGGFGVHKFYLGRTGMGVLYLLFCWTYIPAFIGFIEGIIYLASNDHNFQIKNRVRTH